AGATGQDGAVRARVEGAADALTGQNLAFTVEISRARRDVDGDSAGERQVAFLPEQRLDCQVDGDQRGGTGRLHVHGRTAQVQLVADRRREEIFVVIGVTDQKEPE